MTQTLMEKIDAFAKREQSPNPQCQEPDSCKWAVGVVSCWKCAHIGAGGKIYDWAEGRINPIDRREREFRETKPLAKGEKPDKPKVARKVDTELAFGSDKWNMYANAIPKQVRAKLCVEGADIRAFYKELRADGKEAFLKKYS